MTACYGHHNDSKPVKSQPEETILDISDSLITKQCLLLINPTNNDLVSYGRAGKLLTMQDRLNSLGIKVPIRIVIGEDGKTGLRKRLIKIGQLDSLVITIPKMTFEGIKSKLRTNHPITVIVDSVRKVVMSGDINLPAYKQRIYDLYLRHKTALLLLEDTVVKIYQNPDTFMYIKNGSNNPLVIYEIESSCDCTKVRTESNIIAPHDSTKLYLTHIGNNKNKTLTNILIFSNDRLGIKEVKIDSSPKYQNLSDV